MRRRLALLATIAALTVATAACTSSPTIEWKPSPGSGGPGSSAGTITWRDCTADARKINSSLPASLAAACGTVTVPADWRTATNGKASDGKTFAIAVMRIHSSAEHDPLGSIVINPGGPGGSGFDFAAQLAPRVGGLLTRFDLVGFDPRGVGRSAPVECISNADLDANFGYDPDPASDSSFQGLVTLNQHIASDCAAKYGAQLSLFATEQAARDIDAIRAALGEPKLNYLGFSYGTLLGAVYAELFGRNIRAMVLDGAVDPTQNAIDSAEGQAKGFERAFANFTTWCQQHASQCPISADPRAAVQNAIDTARTAPVAGPGGRKATAGWVFYALVASLYSQDTWPYLARAIDDLGHGRTQYLFLLADSYAERNPDGSYSNLFDANDAINCADAAYPNLDQIRSLQSQWRTRYPLFGAPIAASLVSCSVWRATKDPYPTGKANGSPPIVVIGTTGDPATPYESTARLATMLGTGTVLTWQGEGHTAYPETACIRTAVDTYFIDLQVPKPGTTCPAR